MDNLFEFYFLNIIVNLNFFSDLKFEYYCEYYPEILLQDSLNKKLKLMGGAMKYFPKKLQGHEIWSMVSWATIFFFWKIYKTLQPPPPPHPTYLICSP